MGAVRITPRPGLFLIADYPNTTPGDDATGLRAAFAAAVTHGGGTIQLENRAYTIASADPVATTSNGSALINADNRGSVIDIRGRGVANTKLNLVNPVGSLVGINPVADSPTLWPVNLYDFTINGASSKRVGFMGVIYNYVVSAITNNEFSTTGVHYCERVNTEQFGHSAGTSQRMINWAVNRAGIAGAQARPTALLRGLRVRQCDWGHGAGSATSRGAGQAGVVVVGFVNNSLSDKDATGKWKPSRLYEAGIYNPANVYCDDIVVEDYKYTTGDPMSAANTGPGSPVITGGDGVTGYVLVRDAVIENSSDIGIEMDGCERGRVENVEFINHDGFALYTIPFAGGMGEPSTERWNYVAKDCSIRYEDNAQTSSTFTPQSPAVSFAGRFGAFSRARALYENIHVHWARENQASRTMFVMSGEARDIVMRNCSVDIRGTDTTGGTSNMNGVRIGATSGRTRFTVENFRFDRRSDIDTTHVVDQWLTVQGGGDLDLQIRGATGSSRGALTNSAQRLVRPLLLNYGGNEQTEPFSTDLLDSDWLFDAGLSSDYVYDGASPKTYTATSNLGTEKRAVFVATNTQTDPLGMVGKTVDGGHWNQMVTGSTTRTGYKGGAFAKRQDATTYLEAYAYDDGTNTYLCLDTVKAGVRASLLPAAGGTATGAIAGGNLVTDAITPVTGVSNTGLILAARLSLSETHYPSVLVENNTVYAEIWRATTPSTAGLRPTGTNEGWCSASIASADLFTFGPRGQGESGFTQIPVDNAKLGNARHRNRGVIRGHISDVSIEDFEPAAGTSSAVQVQPSFAAKVRIDGQLVLENSDFSQLSWSSSNKNLDILTGMDVFKQYFKRRNNVWSAAGTQFTDTAITFANGTAWQNQTGCIGTVTIQGGTVTKVEISRDGSTYRDVGVVAGSIRLAPNWWIKLTLTVAPTSYFIQED